MEAETTYSGMKPAVSEFVRELDEKSRDGRAAFFEDLVEEAVSGEGRHAGGLRTVQSARVDCPA
jgi:hypothetical protein